VLIEVPRIQGEYFVQNLARPGGYLTGFTSFEFTIVRLPADTNMPAGAPISSDSGRSTRANCVLVIDDDATARED
jgi:hypothetical protein